MGVALCAKTPPLTNLTLVYGQTKLTSQSLASTTDLHLVILILTQ